jgi:hypothetical protein
MLIVGYRAASTYKGWSALRCQRCECVQPFRVIENTTEHSVYFIQLLKNVELILVCNFCGSAFAAQQKPRITKKWSAKDGLQALVDATHSDLGPIDPSRKPSDVQLKALLDCVEEQTKATKVHVGPGCWMGGIAGAIVGCAIGIGLAYLGFMSKDREAGKTLGCLVGMAGLLVGIFLGGYLYGRSLFRGLARNALREAIQRNQIDIEQLRTIARMYQHKTEAVLGEIRTRPKKK